jgi:hypothetical protein
LKVRVTVTGLSALSSFGGPVVGRVAKAQKYLGYVSLPVILSSPRSPPPSSSSQSRSLNSLDVFHELDQPSPHHIPPKLLPAHGPDQ